jgi:hypothetical protein
MVHAALLLLMLEAAQRGLALAAAAIISAEGASAQGVYLDFSNNPGPRYRDYE